MKRGDLIRVQPPHPLAGAWGTLFNEGGDYVNIHLLQDAASYRKGDLVAILEPHWKYITAAPFNLEMEKLRASLPSTEPQRTLEPPLFTVALQVLQHALDDEKGCILGMYEPEEATINAIADIQAAMCVLQAVQSTVEKKVASGPTTDTPKQ